MRSIVAQLCCQTTLNYYIILDVALIENESEQDQVFYNSPKSHYNVNF